MTIIERERIDKLLELAYTVTDNRLQGVQLAIWDMFIDLYAPQTFDNPTALATLVDHIANFSPETLKDITAHLKMDTRIIIDMVLPTAKHAKK
jgi:hypothetical protein